MVLKEMVNIVIFYTHDSQKQALELFLKFKSSLSTAKLIVSKNRATLVDECFIIRAMPLTEANIRGVCYHLVYVPNDIDHEIECYIRSYGHTSKVEKYN